MLSRICAALLAMAAGFCIWAIQTDFVFRRPLAEAVRERLVEMGGAAALEQKIFGALAAGRSSDAEHYAGVAAYAGLPLSAEALDQLKAQASPEAALGRQAEQFRTGLESGKGDSPAAVAGALAAEGSRAVAIADLATETARKTRGEPYDPMVLSLAALAQVLRGEPQSPEGVARERAASLLKLAHKADMLHPQFAAEAESLVSDALAGWTFAYAGDPPDLAAFAALASATVHQIDASKAQPVLGPVSRLIVLAGPAEALQHLASAKAVRDLQDAAAMAEAFGASARAMTDMTGVRSPDMFAVKFPVPEMIARNFWFWASVLSVLSLFALEGQLRWIGQTLAQAAAARPDPGRRRRMFGRRPVRQLSSLQGDPGNPV
jgi:hypothetical protein